LSVSVDEIKKGVVRETYITLGRNGKIIWHSCRETLRKEIQMRDPGEGGKNYTKICLKVVRYEGENLN